VNSRRVCDDRAVGWDVFIVLIKRSALPSRGYSIKNAKKLREAGACYHYFNMNESVKKEIDLAEHLKTEHKQSAFSNYFKEVIYGGIDGIITTFAVVAGFSGATLANDTTTQLTFLIALLFGLANLFADGVSMGLGNFLSVRSDQDLYNAIRKKEALEMRDHPEYEFQETVAILMKKGYGEADARAMAALYSKNENYWVDFMMAHELKIPDPRGESAIFTSIATFLSFVSFGIIPLVPFMAMPTGEPSVVFMYSVIGTGMALCLLGILKWKVVGTSLKKSLLEVIIIGGIAACMAFLVGSLFEV
jgi:vacuolar iron transporter family protein